MEQVTTAQQLAESLANGQSMVADAKRELAFIQAALEASPLYVTLMQAKQSLAQAEAFLAEARGDAQDYATLAYEACGDRHAVPGVTVVENTVVEYDDAEALEWAKTNAPAMLTIKLNAPAFKSALVAGKIPNMPGTVDTVLGIRVSSDVRKAMGK